jgi:hypothetical protein
MTLTSRGGSIPIGMASMRMVGLHYDKRRFSARPSYAGLTRVSIAFQK